MELDYGTSLLRFEYLKQRYSLTYAGELLGRASFRQETDTDKTGVVMIDERDWNGERKKQGH